VKDEKEKTIPFLRQLTEMLQNNEELISFVPGQRLPNDEIIHGKIIVHDRNRVQAEVLPVYFNHASFASLRRQLSYFSFVRVGKSRQSGVTYTNDLVIDLPDILRLKRRPSGAAAKQVQKRQKKQPQLLPKQEEEQQQEQQMTTTSADDVASAMLSGTQHAAKTNQTLDNNNNISDNGESSMCNPVSHTITSPTPTQSSISQSISPTSVVTPQESQSSISQSASSTTSIDNASNNKCDGNSKSSDSSSNPKNNKSKVCKRRTSSIVKHSIPRKDRARFDRLLTMNSIVPFIHLPEGLTLRPSTKRERSPASGTGITLNAQESAGRQENKPKGRDRATSDGAINALLALGADRPCGTDVEDGGYCPDRANPLLPFSH